jgi:hypothetical protein
VRQKVSVAFHTPFTQASDVLIVNTDSRALKASEAAEKWPHLGGNRGCPLAHEKDGFHAARQRRAESKPLRH